jgi:hypothetical protein
VDPLDAAKLGEWHLDDPAGLFDGMAGFKSLLELEDEDAEMTDLELDQLIENVSIVSTRLGIETLSAQRAVVFLTGEDTKPMPFWREAAYEFNYNAFWEQIGYREQWERLLPMTPDRALDMDALKQSYPHIEWEIMLNRIDVRTYAEHPMLVRGEHADQRIVVTTLRPFGGLGNCPRGVARNPSGAEFLTRLLNLVKS